LVWHLLSRGEDHAFARPALVAWKLRGLELVAGMPSRRGGNGPGLARDYSLRAVRDRERQAMEMAEQEYRASVAAWRRLPPEGRTGAARGEAATRGGRAGRP